LVINEKVSPIKRRYLSKYFLQIVIYVIIEKNLPNHCSLMC